MTNVEIIHDAADDYCRETWTIRILKSNGIYRKDASWTFFNETNAKAKYEYLKSLYR